MLKEPKYNEKGQVRAAFIEENAARVKEIVKELTMLSSDYSFQEDITKLEKWCRGYDSFN